MKLLSAAVIAVALVSPAQAKTHAHLATTKIVRWEGSTDVDMLRQVRADLDAAHKARVGTLRVYLTSPGGPVITSLEIARLVRDASDAGLVIEMHAEALCASGCTFVLSSGTPGHRFISRSALFLVHPPQDMSGCQSYTPDPQTQDDKVKDTLLELMRDSYMRYTGLPQDLIEFWLTCGNEQVGPGGLAVRLIMADATE
jgi:ATP-dependent protease ClpP protease subunit